MREGQLPVGLEVHGIGKDQPRARVKGSRRQESGIFPLVFSLTHALMVCLALSAEVAKSTFRKGESYCCSSTLRKAGRKAKSFWPQRESAMLIWNSWPDPAECASKPRLWVSC